MEDVIWLLVARLFTPLVEPVQPHNWEVFAWSPEFWARMQARPLGQTRHQSHPAKPVCPAHPSGCDRQDEEAIGVFAL